MNNKPTKKPCYSFEEFKLMYESTEKVTDRRHTKNTFNYSICVGGVLALAVIANWSVANSQYKYVSFTLIFLLSIMETAYTRLWLRQIKDLKALNTAKFEVLNEMAPLLKFDSTKSGAGEEIVSYQPFAREWEILKKLNALQNPKRHKIVALKSTDEELFIPKAFQAIFILSTLGSLIAIIFHFTSFIQTWKNILIG
jgi:hypothetical protein